MVIPTEITTGTGSDTGSLLERRFPHIARRLTEAWPDPEQSDEVLNTLLVDDRDGRHGLPPEVFEELMFLSDLNWKRRHFDEDGVEILPEGFAFAEYDVFDRGK